MFFKYDKETRALIDQIESHLAEYESVLMNKLSERTLDQRAAREVFLNDEHRNYLIDQLLTAKQTATKITVVIPNE